MCLASFSLFPLPHITSSARTRNKGDLARPAAAAAVAAVAAAAAAAEAAQHTTLYSCQCPPPSSMRSVEASTRYTATRIFSIGDTETEYHTLKSWRPKENSLLNLSNRSRIVELIVYQNMNACKVTRAELVPLTQAFTSSSCA